MTDNPVLGATERPPTACEKCGGPLFAQWWDKARNGYACRRCGALTIGTPPAARSTRPTRWPFGCAGVLVVLGVLAIIGNSFQLGVGLIAVAGLLAFGSMAVTARRALPPGQAQQVERNLLLGIGLRAAFRSVWHSNRSGPGDDPPDSHF
jgi:hypothetical protein